MKKITTLFAVVALGAALIGCAPKDDSAASSTTTPAATAGTTGDAATK